MEQQAVALEALAQAARALGIPPPPTASSSSSSGPPPPPRFGAISSTLSATDRFLASLCGEDQSGPPSLLGCIPVAPSAVSFGSNVLVSSTLDPAVVLQDPTFAAIAHLLKTAPPKLPEDAQGGCFVIDQEKGVYIIPKPSLPSEDYLLYKAQQEANRWVTVTGLHSHASGTAKGRELKPLFDSLVEPVRTLQHLRCSWPFPSEFLDSLVAAREALWHRLRCLVVQAKYGPAAAAAFEEGELVGEDKKEAAAAAKGCKADQQGKSGVSDGGGKSKKKQRGTAGDTGKKTCHICGGSSHLQRKCPKRLSGSGSGPSK
jgi:hypothetical protein